MRHTLLLPLLLLAMVPLRAQQLPQLSQYVSNDYLYNPSVAGSRPWFEMRSAHRYQWVGIQDAPRTFMLSATTPIGARMGLGGFLFTDHVGPTRRTGFQLTYAYHLRITEDLRLALSLSGGLVQFLIDGSKITFHDGYDPVMDDQLRGDVLPDATFAFLLYHPKFWFGATAPQLFQNKIYFFDQQDQSLSRLERHYFATGGYRQKLGEDLSLEPSFLVKYVNPVPPKIDLNLTLRYKDVLWIGGGWRSNDAIPLMVGCWVKKMFQFGYSYDLTTNGLSQYAQGTHEVMLGITFSKERPGPLVNSAVPAPVTP
ncbi:MAG: type IX secretion system membrane protein PorP/SprF [Flavobacteriales bacterium]|nr:type IX secretion system membrane protein PorP/SprF [Flavobacteriales bacterium]